METAIGSLIFIIIFGQIVMPQWIAISTSGWGTYTGLLWAIVPLVVLASFIIGVVDAAKGGYRSLSGAPW